MELRFYGAAHAVTGSCHYVSACGMRLLVDCGLQQGKDEVDDQAFPFSAGQIDAVLVTHAHIDHSGRLPLLVKQGFRGPIYATGLTCKLLSIMLLDSAHIQESDASWANQKGRRAGKEAVEPLYTVADAEAALKLLVPVDYGQTVSLGEGVQFRMTDAGHLLGSAYVELWLREGDVGRKLAFSGDIGNTHQPIIRDPQPISGADYVIMESTYGDRNHGVHGGYVSKLVEVLNDTFAKGGNVIIPSFAVGRIQELLYFLREIKLAGLVTSLPDFEVVVDSPLATQATQIFSGDLTGYLDEDALALVADGISLFQVDGLRLTQTSEESKALNADMTPKVIISASGMCDAGRIRHHLKHNLWRPECAVVFVGYQAQGTLGRALLEGKEHVRLFGEDVAVRASIVQLDGMSSHADHDALIRWVSQFDQPRPAQVFVVHGDGPVCEGFAAELNRMGYPAHAPEWREVFDLASGLVTQQGIAPPKKQASKWQEGSPAYRRLEEAGRQLLEVIGRNKGGTNKDLAKFTDQIRALIQKWDR
ncbi:MAG: MBL fold metallo-hydrolase [Clostridiales bacterium]|nr:MBL fold metallo-hydrolase [Clostridiales bacterium]